MRRWLPGADQKREDVWLSIANMCPTPVGTYHTAPCFAANGTLTGGNAGTANYVTYLCWSAQIADGTPVTYVAGEDSSGAGNFFVESLSGITLTNRSLGGTNFGTGIDGTKIAFAQMGNTSLFSHNSGTSGSLYSRDASGSGNFALGSASGGKILAVQSNALVMYNLYDGAANKPNYWMASDLFAPTTFTGGESVTATPVVTTPGEITAAVPFGDSIIFFKRAGVYRHKYVGTTDVKWTVQLLRSDIGVKCQHAVIDTGNSLVFLGEQGVWEYDGATFRKLSEDADTSDGLGVSIYVQNPRASMYFPGDDCCVWFNASDVLFYNRKFQAFGSMSITDTSGSVLTSHVPYVGKVPALVEAGVMPNAMAHSFVSGMQIVNVAASSRRSGTSQWHGQIAASVTSGYIGEYDKDITISQIVPMLRGNYYPFGVTNLPTTGLETTTPFAANSSTNRRRFDGFATVAYPNGNQVTIRNRITVGGAWEIADILIPERPSGKT